MSRDILRLRRRRMSEKGSRNYPPGGEVTRRASGSVVPLVSLSLSQFSKNHRDETKSSAPGPWE